MAAVEITKRTYAPSGLVGKFYMAPFSAPGLLEPIGNVLEASTEQTEEVEKQPDMTALGGGTHAEIRRVTGVKFKAKLADLNIVIRSRPRTSRCSWIGAHGAGRGRQVFMHRRGRL